MILALCGVLLVEPGPGFRASPSPHESSTSTQAPVLIKWFEMFPEHTAKCSLCVGEASLEGNHESDER